MSVPDGKAIPQGLKPSLDRLVTARLKPRPDTQHEFFCSLYSRVSAAVLTARLKLCPDTQHEFFRSLYSRVSAAALTARLKACPPARVASVIEEFAVEGREFPTSRKEREIPGFAVRSASQCSSCGFH
jgi:hypothetical protein